MRTTLTIDDDLYDTVQAMAKASGKELGQVASDLLRQSLSLLASAPPAESDPKFSVHYLPGHGKRHRSCQI